MTPQPDKPSVDAAHGTVQTLSRMIKGLEGQLDRMIAINDALEGDLDKERARGSKLERKVLDLMQKLQRAEQENVGKEDLQAQIAHLNGERSRLARKAEALTQSLDTAEEASRKHGELVKRLRAGRADALEELHSIETQFERAMKMVSDLKSRVSVLGEDYEALRLRLKTTDDSRRHAEDERDALLAEVEESRTALEDIRRSLVDACVVSQQRLDD